VQWCVCVTRAHSHFSGQQQVISNFEWTCTQLHNLHSPWVSAGACGGGSGMIPETFTVTVAAANGGEPCAHANGATRTITACVNNNPCPVPCTSSWQPNGACTGACGGGTGTLPEILVVTSAALHGGSCPGANGVLAAQGRTQHYGRHTLPQASTYTECLVHSFCARRHNTFNHCMHQCGGLPTCQLCGVMGL
jgi:hypothetical protein